MDSKDAVIVDWVNNLELSFFPWVGHKTECDKVIPLCTCNIDNFFNDYFS